MKFRLPSLTTVLCALILIVIAFALIYAGRTRDVIMSEAQAAECVDCVHYVNRIEGRIARMKNVRENPQFFRYALDKSCRGQMYLAGHCQKFRREFRKDVDRYMLEVQQPSLADEYDMKYFWSAVKDWKIWVYMFITVGNEEAQLITVPPYVVACFFCIGGGFLADRQGSRGLSMIFFNVVA
ncbi:hypothetical protein BDW62DRAFT_204735 [Aspergillus aurantiobrunneus]